MRYWAALLTAAALAGAEKVPLSMKQAVEIALAPEGAARMRLAEEAIAAAKAREGQARAALLPNIDGSVNVQNFTRNLQAFGIIIPPSTGFTMQDIVGPINNVDFRAVGTMTVFDFAAWKRLGAAKAGEAAAVAEKESAKNAIAEGVARAYVAALRADAAVQLAQSSVSLAERLRKLANDQKEAGTGTGIEVLRADVQMANERQRLTLAETDSRRAKLQLARALNLGLEREIELTDKLALPEANTPGLAEAMDAARQNRKDLSAQALREEVARRTYDSVKWERLPSVGAFGDIGGIGLDLGTVRTTRTYGATLRIPIFDGGRRDARRSEAASLLRQDHIRTDDLRKQVELDVRVSMDAITAAADQVKVSEEGMALAERELEQAQRRYSGGVTSNVEVVDAQTRTERARDNRIAALYQYNQARIDLAAAMGAIHRILQ